LDIYHRQKTLNLNVPRSVAVIGVGGVGSWVALDFALVGVKKIVLVDKDIVEEHNLNRTPFRLFDIGELKVKALAEIIFERRDDVSVIPIGKHIEELEDFELDEVKQCDCVFDCRDTSKPLKKDIAEKIPIIGGYDGYTVTLHAKPKYQTVWGREFGPVTYTYVPSFIVPPQFIATMIVLYTCTRIDNQEKVVTFDVRNLLKKLLRRGL